VVIHSYYNWRASKASETLFGVNNGTRRYMYVIGARY